MKQYVIPNNIVHLQVALVPIIRSCKGTKEG